MKKFIISSDVLKKALSKLNHAIPKNSGISFLGSILCKVTNNSIEFTSTDLEITIQYQCECETSKEGFEFLLPFQLIHKIIGLNKSTPLAFSLEKKGIKIIGDNDIYELKTLEPVDQFPKVPTLPKEVPMLLNEDFVPLMTKALATISKNESWPQLMNVLLELKEEKITIASTDGTFSVFSYSLPNGTSYEDNLLISEKAIKSLEGLSDISLLWNKKNVVFKTKDITITLTRSNLAFANFRAIIPQDFPSNLKVNRAELIHALEKCNINSDALKETDLDLKTMSGKIILLAKDTNYNVDIKIMVGAEYTGSVSSIRFNSDKMLKLLNQVDFDEIELAIHEPNKAILFRSPDHEGYISLLMPIYNNK